VTIEALTDVLEQQGAEQYGSERVSQLQHALQCAWLAEKEEHDVSLIAAALLHDIGHLRHQFGENHVLRGIDDRHEDIGYKYLSQHFPDAVCKPVQMHVDAKRYLCAVDTHYLETLSEGSVRSLELQGGPYNNIEAANFIQKPFAREAVKLRIWDDLAKEPDLETPPLSHFLPFLGSCYISMAQVS